MDDNIEKKISDFQNMLESDDPIILQKLQIEIQLETLRLMAYGLQGANDKLGAMEDRINSMDWKLWEIAKVANPKLDSDGDNIPDSEDGSTTK